MNCVILYRVNGGKVQFVMEMGEPGQESTGDICEFPSIAAAMTYADANRIFASGQVDYQFVELDEL